MSSQIERLRQMIADEPRRQEEAAQHRRQERELWEQQRLRAAQEFRYEARKFVVQALIAAAALIGVGIALGRFFLFHA